MPPMAFARLVKASRPVMWVPTMLAYLVGMESFRNFSPLALLELALFAFPLNFFLYGLNDVYDLETDRANPRKGDAQGLLISEGERRFLLKAVYLPPLVALSCAARFGSAAHALMMGLFVLSSFAYSHPWIRAKGIPFVDTFTSATVYLSPILVARTIHAPLVSLDPALLLLLLPASGIHTVTTLTDYEEDRRANVTTTAVFLGRRRASVYALLTFVAPMAVFRHQTIILAALVQSALFVLFRFVPDRNQRGERFGELGGTVFAGLWAVVMLYSIFRHNIG
jgi:4-hydroxybenzoate polyprenyltransferase